MAAIRLTYIYALSDPRDNCVRYIGKADEPVRRLRFHLTPEALAVHSHKNSWLRGLLAAGFKPTLTIVEEVETSHWQAAERHWIAFYGAALTNGTSGGDGLHDPDALTRLKMSTRRGQAPWNKGRRMTPEEKDRYRAAGLWSSRPGYWKGKHVPPHVQAALRAARIGRPSWNKGVPMAATTRLKLSRCWVLVSPDGKEIELRNLKEFCRQQGLEVSLMHHVATGKRRQHRGWTCRRAASLS